MGFCLSGDYRPMSKVTARDVVAAYVDARTDAGLLTDIALRGVMGRYSKPLLAYGWTSEVVLDAVKQFAATKRHPRFVEEWVRETYTKWELLEYEVRKQQEQTPPPAHIMAIIGRPVRRIE